MRRMREAGAKSEVERQTEKDSEQSSNVEWLKDIEPQHKFFKTI